MAADGVFDQTKRVDPSPARHGEGTFEFLNRADGHYWQQVRVLLEGWFAHLPADAQPDLRARLRSRDDRQFSAAFFELYLHESLIRGDFRVECHPQVPNSPRRPDFLVRSGSGSFYLEARSVSESDLDAAASNRLARMYETLDRLNSPNFFVSVNVYSVGGSDIRSRKLRSLLEQWLGGFDPDEVGRLYNQQGAGSLPELTWTDRDWKISFSVIPKKVDARGVIGLRPLGAFGSGRAKSVDNVSPIRRALADKGSAYGELDYPFIVALRQQSVFAESYAINQALFGSEQVDMVMGSDGQWASHQGRAGDGFWLANGTWRNREVSAVVSVGNLNPWSVTSQVPVLWQHPESTRRVAAPPFWSRVELVGDTLTTTYATIEPADHFELPKPWPVGRPFSN